MSRTSQIHLSALRQGLPSPPCSAKYMASHSWVKGLDLLYKQPQEALAHPTKRAANKWDCSGHVMIVDHWIENLLSHT